MINNNYMNFDDTMKQRANDIYYVLMSEARVKRDLEWFRAKQEANKFWLMFIDNNPNKNEITKTVANDIGWIEHRMPQIKDDLDEIADTKFELRDNLGSWLDEAYEDLAQLDIKLSNAKNGRETSETVEQIKLLRYNIGLVIAFKAILEGQPVIDSNQEDN